MEGKAICQPQIIDNKGRGMIYCKGASTEFVAFISFILSYLKKEKQVWLKVNVQKSWMLGT